jgi:hypothetical protein
MWRHFKLSLGRIRACTAETENGLATFRLHAIADRNSGCVANGEIVSTSGNSLLATAWSLWIQWWADTVILWVVPITYPFHHISGQIMYAVGARTIRKLTNGGCGSLQIVIIQ